MKTNALLFREVLDSYYSGVKMPLSELRWFVPRLSPYTNMTIWGIPSVGVDVDRVYLAISANQTKDKNDDLYDAFRAGWMKGLDESKNVDELYAEWKKEK